MKGSLLLLCLWLLYIFIQCSGQAVSLDGPSIQNPANATNTTSDEDDDTYYGLNVEDIVDNDQAVTKASYHWQLLESPLNDLTWCTTKKGKTIALGITNKGVVYRSTNHGLKWESMEKDFEETGLDVLEKKRDEIGK
jgi:hypothetical protein